MIRKISDYLPTALADLKGRLMSDCSEVLYHGGKSATVTRVGTSKRGEDLASDLEPTEVCRVLASFRDFPDMARWEIVTYRDRPRLVTVAKTDPSRSMLTIGMTDPLEPVAFLVERPGGLRRGTLMSCITKEGVAEVFADDGTSAAIWQLSLVFRHVDWAAAVGTPPQSGDRFTSPVTHKTFALMEAQSFESNWSVTAREVPSDNGLL